MEIFEKKVSNKIAFTLAEGGRSPQLIHSELTTRHSELVSESLTVADCNSREVDLTGQTNIDRFQSTRQTGSHNSQARWFALSNEFGMTKRCAFTLAEVLITLGIIGIVAAMTLPTIIHKYQAKVFETRFKKSVATITEIINRTRYDLGIENLWEYCHSNTAQCYTNISNNIIPLEKTKIRSNQQYNIERSYDDLYTYNGKSKVELSTNERALLFTNELKDGTFLGYNASTTYLSFAVDLNGYGKPNRLGHDIFYFRVSKDTKSQLTFDEPKNNITDEQATQKWENSDSVNKNYHMSKEGNPCNKTSTRAGNGIGCAYYALKNICPDDSTKTYWECLPR